jgi:hypothetical protein
MNQPESRTARGYSFGVLLLLFAGFLLYFSRSIERRGAIGNDDPGPTAFPVGVALCLLAGGIYELGSAFRARRQSESAPATRSRRWGLDRRHLDALLLLLMLAVYLITLPGLGFNVGTFIFASAMMFWLGTRWWVALSASMVLVATIQLLFARTFAVPLPTSEWGLPI